MTAFALLMLAVGLLGCASKPSIERSNMITYGRLIRMMPLSGAPDVYGRTRWSMQYDIRLANGETLQVVTEPDPSALLTDCLEVGYLGEKITSLAVVDPMLGCANIPVPNHLAQPLFR